MKPFLCLVMLAVLAGTGPAAGQQSPKVFQDKDVTESALIDALTPAQREAGEADSTRSLRVTREDAAPAAPVAAAPASASLLITFQTNSAELSAQAKRALGVVGQALQSPQLGTFRFAIEGHADPRGTHQGNLVLSQRRAESVRQYLVQNEGIDGNRLEASGKGDTDLMNRDNPTAPENRRVTIINLAR